MIELLIIHAICLLQAMDFFDMGEGFSSLLDGVSRVKCPTMIIGVQTDILIPVAQQRQIASLLRESGQCYTSPRPVLVLNKDR